MAEIISRRGGCRGNMKIPGVQKPKDKTKNNWKIEVCIDGKRKSRTVYPDKNFSRKRLEEYLLNEKLKLQNEVRSETYKNLEKMSFDSFIARWKKHIKEEVSPTTYVALCNRLNVHILPVLKSKNMDSIKPLMLDDLLTNLERKDGKEGPLSLASKQDVYKTLRSLFGFAKSKNIIMENPMEGVTKPRDKNGLIRKPDVYEPDEMKSIIQIIKKEPKRWAIFIKLAFTLGLRRSELLGLEWANINFEQSIIDVCQVITKGEKGSVIKGPKSKSSYRLVSVPQSVMEDLINYHREWLTTKERMGSKWTEHSRNWVFCNLDGTHIKPDTATQWWSRFCCRQSIRYINLHSLRHTSATLLIAQGIHAKTISERLGHSKISVTMDIYGHALRSADKAAADAFESYLQPRNTNYTENSVTQSIVSQTGSSRKSVVK